MTDEIKLSRLIAKQRKTERAVQRAYLKWWNMDPRTGTAEQRAWREYMRAAELDIATSTELEQARAVRCETYA